MTTMNRREWMALAGLSLTAGFTGCAGAGRPPAITGFQANRRLLASNRGGYGVWADGRLIEGGGLDFRMESFSLTKAFASLAVVRAIAEGWMRPDEPLARDLPEWAADRSKSAITPRMLVNQTAGFPSGSPTLYRNFVRDKGSSALKLPVTHPPGSRFCYGPACWEILAEFMHRVLVRRGKSLEGFVGQIMRRAGISSPRWRSDASGRPYLSTGAWFSVKDMGKFGGIIGALAGGESAAGFDAGIFRDLSRPTTANPMFGTGIWWNRNAAKPGARATEPEQVLDGVRPPAFWQTACLDSGVSPSWMALVGSGGKRIYVLPEKRLVIARLGPSGVWSDRALLSSLSVS